MKSEGAVIAMSPSNHAKCHCISGSTVVFQTLDCYEGNIKSEKDLFQQLDYSKINPATGPLYIDGAEPGDILKVEILNIKLEEQGCMALMSGAGPFGTFIKEEKTKIIEVKNGYVMFNNLVKIPISPMIGVIGIAPQNKAILNGTPGEHGSNMDCRKIQAGTSLYLSVNVPGALLSIGDLHAVMGDGEVATCGVEINGEVTVRVSVFKDIKIPTPLLRTKKEYITIASAKTIDEAGEKASIKMLELLRVATDLDVSERIMLLSLIGNIEICQVVNPLKTARMAIPTWILNQYNFILP